MKYVHMFGLIRLWIVILSLWFLTNCACGVKSAKSCSVDSDCEEGYCFQNTCFSLSCQNHSECFGDRKCDNSQCIAEQTIPASTWFEVNVPGDIATYAPWRAIAASPDGKRLAAAVDGGFIYVSDDKGQSWVEQTEAGRKSWTDITFTADSKEIAATAKFTEGGISVSSDKQWRKVKEHEDWETIAAFNGGMVAAEWGSLVWLSRNNGDSWEGQDTQTLGSRFWVGVSASADGNKIAAVASKADDSLGVIVVSTDNGVSWGTRHIINEEKEEETFHSVAYTPDGSKLVVGAGSGKLYKSENDGQTWEAFGKESGHWTSLAFSSDGIEFAAADWNVGIRTTSDFGQKWTIRDSKSGTNSIAILGKSSQSLLARVTSDTIDTLIDEKWTPNLNAGRRFWSSINISSEGYIAAAVKGGYVYSAGKSWTDWKEHEVSPCPWTSIASSADGTKLIASCFDGFIYRFDSQTWTPQGPPKEGRWIAVASSENGEVVSAASDDSIWIFRENGWKNDESSPTPTCHWTSMAASSDGQIQALTAGSSCSDYVYLRSKKDQGWVKQEEPGRKKWKSIARSANGIIAAVAGSAWEEDGGEFWISRNGGKDWENIAAKIEWTAVAISQDGSKIAAVADNNYPYIIINEDNNPQPLVKAGKKHWTSVAIYSDPSKSSDEYSIAAGTSQDNGLWVYRATH